MSSSRGGRGAALLIALRKRQDEERKKLQELEAAVSTTQGSESTTTVTEEDSTVEAARQSLETSSMHHDPPPPPSSSETATSSSTTITLPSTSMDSASSKSAESVTKAPFKLKEPLKYHGSAGREIKLACNYLVMEVEKDKGIFEYGVSFSPGVDSAPERFKLLNQHRETFGLSKVFDGSRLLLPFKMKEDKTTLVASKITGEAEGQSGEEVEIQVSFRRKKELEDPECLQLFNSIFKRLFKKLNLAQMKSGLNLRSYFDPSNRQAR